MKRKKKFLQYLLEEHSIDEESVHQDLNSLIAITSEVKAINNQAALLHGERIKKAQAILKNYKDGAFSSWLVAAYGNRQTPYNFLQYYDFWNHMPLQLRPKVEVMPRQAVYTLASRDGEFEEKKDIVKNYDGETKNELMVLIRETFPLGEGDKRRENVTEGIIKRLCQIRASLTRRRIKTSKRQRDTMNQLMEDIQSIIKGSI